MQQHFYFLISHQRKTKKISKMYIKVIALFALVCTSQAQLLPTSSSGIANLLQRFIPTRCDSINPVQWFTSRVPSSIRERLGVAKETAEQYALECIQNNIGAIQKLADDMVKVIDEIDQKLTQGRPESELNKHEKIQREQLNAVKQTLKEAPGNVQNALNKKDLSATTDAFQGARKKVFDQLQVIVNDVNGARLDGWDENVDANEATLLILDFHRVSFNGAQGVINKVLVCFAKNVASGAFKRFG